MKTLGRILIIVAAFVLVMGIAYAVVNATDSSVTAPTFERGAQGLIRRDGARPPFPNGERSEFRGEGSRGGGSMFVFGLIKNIGVITIVVALIALPKSLMRRKTHPV